MTTAAAGARSSTGSRVWCIRLVQTFHQNHALTVGVRTHAHICCAQNQARAHNSCFDRHLNPHAQPATTTRPRVTQPPQMTVCTLAAVPSQRVQDAQAAARLCVQAVVHALLGAGVRQQAIQVHTCSPAQYPGDDRLGGIPFYFCVPRRADGWSVFTPERVAVWTQQYISMGVGQASAACLSVCVDELAHPTPFIYFKHELLPYPVSLFNVCAVRLVPACVTRPSAPGLPGARARTARVASCARCARRHWG